MESMNISENHIDYVIVEIKDLFSRIIITDEVLRQCRYDNMNLSVFLWDEYRASKNNYIECESEIKRCLFAVAEALIKLVRESENFEKNALVQISNSIDDIDLDIHNISNYMKKNFNKLDVDNQNTINILLMILEQIQKKNMHDNGADSITVESKKFQNNKKQDYIKKWNSRLFLHVDNDENPITLADAFIMPYYKRNKFKHRIGFSNNDTLGQIIEKFVNYNKSSTMLIGGMPGIGKSTITSWLANRYRDDNKFIILRFRDWESKELESGLLKAICNTLECKKRELNNKIFIIDGFDEMKLLNKREKILDDFANDIKDFDNIKFIITSRPAYISSLNFDIFLELRPFNINQIERFYEIITRNSINSNIDYDNIDVFGIPVILYMAIMSNINITKTTTKPQLYNRIFAEKGGIFDRFYDGEFEYDKGAQILRKPKNIKEYLDFLRKIAFMMFESNSLLLMTKDCEIPKLEFGENSVSILEFPIKHLFENTEANIEFIHKSMYEYFVSEYIFWSIYRVLNMSDNELACSLGETLEGNILSEEIIEFLRYKFKSCEKMMKEFEHLICVFEMMLKDGMTYYVKKRLKNVIDREVIIFTNILHVLHFWEFDSLRVNSTLMSYYLRGNRITYNLSNVNLMRANLRGVDLINANLEKTNLRKTDLRGANLRGANLKRANLSGADLRRADLRGAKLDGSIWYEPDIRKALLQLKEASFINLMIRESNAIREVKRSELFPDEKINNNFD